MDITYKIKIADTERDLPLCKISDDVYIAAFVTLGDVELTVKCAEKMLELAPPHDIIITAEAKGIPLVQEMARQGGEKRYLIARKSHKLYMKNAFSTDITSITTANKQTLYLNGSDIDLIQNKRVLIVDDVISTGGSLRAVESLVEKCGGKIAGKMAILAEGDAKDFDDIIYLQYLPLFDAKGKAML